MAYYTFRLLQMEPLRVECSKWDDGYRPVDTYIVHLKTNSCSCVAMKRECKHVLRAQEITKSPELMQDMCRWRWDEKNGWTEMLDIPDLEQFEREVFVS